MLQCNRKACYLGYSVTEKFANWVNSMLQCNREACYLHLGQSYSVEERLAIWVNVVV